MYFKHVVKVNAARETKCFGQTNWGKEWLIFVHNACLRTSEEIRREKLSLRQQNLLISCGFLQFFSGEVVFLNHVEMFF